MEISETDVQSAAEIKETLPAMAADNPEQIRRERKTPATVGKKLFRQTLGKGLPKRWKGGGDYFFEQQEDGSLKITGGDKARNLTGGKSVVITDSEKLKEIYEKAHGGDVLEADVTYKVEDDLYNKEELGKMMKGPGEAAEYSESSLKEMGQNVQEPLYDSKEELAKMMVGKTEFLPTPGVAKVADQGGILAYAAGKEEPSDVMGKVQDLLSRTAQEAERAGDSETVAKLQSLLKMIGIG